MRTPGLRVRAWVSLALCAATTTSPANGADPQPYTVEIAPSGVPGADGPIHDSSNLVSLRESSPVGPFALVTRAQEDAGRIKTALNSFGYYDAQVTIRMLGRPLDDAGLPDAIEAAPAAPIQVSIGIVPGTLFHLRRVTLTGDVPDAARESLKLDAGAPAIATEILAAQGRMLDRLRQTGHALAQVDAPVAMLDAPAHALDVSFAVRAGPRVDLGPIAIRGLDRVDEGFVRRRLLVHPGELYDPDEIERARQDLANLGVFSTVRVRTADGLDAEGRIPLIVETTERARHAVGATAAYSTDLGASAGVTFQHRNLFGQAERLDLGAAITQIGGSESRRPGYNVTAALTKPDWLARDQSITGNLQAVKESLDAYDRTALLAGVTVSRKFSDIYTASVGVTGTQERVSQEGVNRTYTLAALPIGLRVDSTGKEGLFEPTHGYKAAAIVTPTESLSARGSTYTILQLTASTYVNLGAPGRSVLAVRGVLGSVQGAATFDLPPDQRFYAGGSGTVRGYKYQSIGPRFADARPVGGTSLGAATLEFRQRFGESFGAAVFADAGNVGSTSAPFSGKLRAGVGAGARYYTAIGPIRVDIALPLQKERKDDAFELYIGIGQAF